MIRKKLFPLFLLFFMSHFLYSQSIIKEAEDLMDQRQYKSAWTYLHDHADEIDFSSFIIKKTELSLRYFLTSNMHQMFAFKDLNEGENLQDLRREQTEQDLKLFDPAGALILALEKDTENALLYYWLGEYYHEVLRLYDSGWLQSKEEIYPLLKENFQQAVNKGLRNGETLSKLGSAHLYLGEWESAIDLLEQAMAISGETAEIHYNIAVAHLNNEDFKKADKSINRAIPLYSNPYFKGDAYFMASTIALYQSDTEKGTEYLNKGFDCSPEDYRFPDRLIRLHLSLGNYEEARNAAADLFALYPKNPANCTTIIQYFYNHGKLEETDLFFDEQIKVFTGQYEALGNLYIHKGIAAQYQGNNERGMAAFEAAELEFKKIHPLDHEVFNALEKMKSELK